MEKTVKGFISTRKYDNHVLEVNIEQAEQGDLYYVYLVRYNIMRFEKGMMNVLFN